MERKEVRKIDSLLQQFVKANRLERGLAEGEPGNCQPSGTVAGVQVGCFPNLYAALASSPPDQVITL